MRIYKNSRGRIKYDFSQIKDKKNSALVKRIFEEEGVSIQADNPNSAKTGKNNKKRSVPQKSPCTGFPVIGTDESGKGDYFGPLVAAGIYVDEKAALFLKDIGAADSKLLTDTKIKAIAKKIKEKLPDCYAVIEISPDKYNRLYESFRMENKNLNSLLAWAHAKAIEEVLSKKECKTIISDQFADERYIAGRLQERGRKANLIQMHRAERNIAVAAASILARERFLHRMDLLSSRAGINLPKGASPAVISAGKRLVREKGEESLRDFAKIHFKTTDKIKKT